MKFFGKVGRGSKTNRLDFDDDPDHVADPDSEIKSIGGGLCSPSPSSFIGLYLTGGGQCYIQGGPKNWHNFLYALILPNINRF